MRAASPPNDQYGTREAPVIQQNGDPCVDNLYTQSFALLGLNEAAAASSDAALAAEITACRDKIGGIFLSAPSRSRTKRPITVSGSVPLTMKSGRPTAATAIPPGVSGRPNPGWTEAWINHGLSMIVLDANLWDLSAEMDMAASL